MPTGARKVQGHQGYRRYMRLTCTCSWIHLRLKEKDHAAAYAARAVYDRSEVGRNDVLCHNKPGFGRRPDESNFCATTIGLVDRCVRHGGQTRDVSYCAETFNLKCRARLLLR